MSILTESLTDQLKTAGDPASMSGSQQLPKPVDGRSYIVGQNTPALKYTTIPEMLRETVAKNGPRDAVVFPNDGLTLSYYDLDRLVDELASGFLALGLSKGDRLGIWSPNRLEWILTQFATARIGIILVNINPAYRALELKYALNKAGCVALVLAEKFKSSDYAQMLKSLAPELAHCKPGKLAAAKLPSLRSVIVMSDDPLPGAHSFSSIQTLGGPAQQLRLDAIADSLNPDDPINIQFTSGTTGSPKGATLSHYNITNNARAVTDRMGVSEHDRLCIPVPLYHCFGMVLGTLGCVAQGAAMVFPGEAFSAADTIKAVSAARCTALYGVPTMFVAMLEELNRNTNYDLSALRTGIMAGAPCPIEVMRRVIDEMNMSQVTICYGMTETSPVSFQSFVDDPLDKRVTTVGRVHPHVEVKIIDEEGNIVPVGTKGELCTRGYCVMRGYWEDEDRTRESVRDGWMHTGDLAVIDVEGYCSIVGRVNDMIIRGGENIYPKEIEDFLFSHPKVEQAQVFGIPDATLGETVCAWIVPKKGEQLMDEEIRTFCEGQIAHFKIPRQIRLVEELPMTVTGKPQKFVMRDWMIDNGYTN